MSIDWSRIPVIKIKYDDILRAIRANGYNARKYRPADIRFELYTILVDDIKAGETDWPVVTGYSRSGFYTDGEALWNAAPYASPLEHRRKRVKGYAPHPIRRYVKAHLRGLVKAALDLIGARPGKTSARQLTLFDRGAGLTQLLLGVTGGSGLIEARAFSQLAISRRRLLRTYRPFNFDIRNFR